MPLRSVEAASRDDAIAAAREQFGPQARIIGVRRVRSGGVLGFFATERYVAEVAEVAEPVPDSPARPAVPARTRQDDDGGPADFSSPLASAAPARARAAAPARNGAAAWAAEAASRSADDIPPEVRAAAAAARAERTGAVARPAPVAASAQDRAEKPVRPLHRVAAARADDDRVSELVGLLAAQQSEPAAPAYSRASFPRASVARTETVARGESLVDSLIDDEVPAPTGRDADERITSAGPSPFTAALARMVAGDQDVRHAVQEALATPAETRPRDDAEPWPVRSEPVRTADTAVPPTAHQEEETVGDQVVAPPSTTDRPVEVPPWAAEPEVAAASVSPREEAIADLLRGALAQGHSDEALAGILRKVLDGASARTVLPGQGSAPAEPLAAEPLAAEPLAAAPLAAAPLAAVSLATESVSAEPAPASPLAATPAFAVPAEPVFAVPSEPAFAVPAEPAFADPAEPAFAVPAELAFAGPAVAVPAVEVAVPAVEVAVPAVEVAVPAVEVAVPAVELPAVDVPAAPVLEAPVAPVVAEPVAESPAVETVPSVAESTPPSPPVVPSPAADPMWGTVSAFATLWAEPVSTPVPLAAEAVTVEPAPLFPEAAGTGSVEVPAESSSAEEPVAEVTEVTEAIESTDALAEADETVEAPAAEEPTEAFVEESGVAEMAPVLARTASDPAPMMSLDATTVMPPLSLLPPLPSSRGRGRPPVPPVAPRPGSSSARPPVPAPAEPAAPAATEPVESPTPGTPSTGIPKAEAPAVAPRSLATVTRLPVAPLMAGPETPELPEDVEAPAVEELIDPAPPAAVAVATGDVAQQLQVLGVPAELLSSTFAEDVAERGTYAALTRSLALHLPKAPEVPSGAGEAVFVVGPGVDALRAARSLAASLRLDPDRVQWATRGDLAGLAPKGSRVTTVDAAIDRHQEAVAAGTVTIVAVDAPLRTDAYWMAQMMTVWTPVAVWAVVEATRKPEDLEPWIGGLPRVDALIVQDTDLSADPAAVLRRVNAPVALLDGVRATPHRWASLLCERLESATT